MNFTIGRNNGANGLFTQNHSRNNKREITAQFPKKESDKSRIKNLTYDGDQYSSNKRDQPILRSSEMFRSPSAASPQFQ